MSSRRILIIGEMPPLPGCPTTGAGLRAWGIAKGLEARGHEVIFSMPALYLDKGWEIPATIARYAWHAAGIGRIVDRVSPDVVIFCHWPTVQVVHKLDIPTVLDFHGPQVLEREFQGYSSRAASSWDKLAAIRKSDFFTCAGENQRLYFLGWLVVAGIPLDNLDVASVPVCLSPDMPAHEWDDGEPTFVYGGLFLPWQDPSAGLRTLVQCMESHRRGRLKFFGGKHPGCPDDFGRLEHFEALGKELERSPRAQYMGFVAHDELVEEYRRAHVALDVMARNPERELAFTTRTVEYLWCGLPVIYHDYSELSRLIRDHQAGWVVNPADGSQIRAAVEEALTCPAEVRRRGENAQRLVREHLTWDTAVEPLDAYCRNPWQRETLSMPIWAKPPKSLPRLLREVSDNFHQGGLRTVVHYGLRYIERQLSTSQE